MTLEEILNLTPESLAETQLEALKKDTRARLLRIVSKIDKDDFDIDDLTSFSPSGDGYGEDNYYITFHCGDIKDTFYQMGHLKKISSI